MAHDSDPKPLPRRQSRPAPIPPGPARQNSCRSPRSLQLWSGAAALDCAQPAAALTCWQPCCRGQTTISEKIHPSELLRRPSWIARTTERRCFSAPICIGFHQAHLWKERRETGQILSCEGIHRNHFAKKRSGETGPQANAGQRGSWSATSPDGTVRPTLRRTSG